MNSKTQRYLKIAFAVVAIAATLIAVHLATRWNSVAALQHSLARNWEITFQSEDVPVLIPDAWDRWIYGALSDRHEGENEGREWPTVWEEVLHARYRSLFRGRIRLLGIYYFESFDSNFPDALANFGSLEELEIYENTFFREIAEDDIGRLCEVIRNLEHLKRLEIGSWWISDEHIEYLKGHPSLVELDLNEASRLTPACLTAIATMPNLRILKLGALELSDDELATTREMMPRVELHL